MVFDMDGWTYAVVDNLLQKSNAEVGQRERGTGNPPEAGRPAKAGRPRNAECGVTTATANGKRRAGQGTVDRKRARPTEFSRSPRPGEVFDLATARRGNAGSRKTQQPQPQRAPRTQRDTGKRQAAGRGRPRLSCYQSATGTIDSSHGARARGNNERPIPLPLFPQAPEGAPEGPFNRP